MKKIILFAFLLGNVALYGQSTVATINKGYKLNAGQYLDTRMGSILAGKSVPYSGVSAANAAIFPSFRCVGMTVLIDTLGSMKEYWCLAGTANGNLVPKETGGGTAYSFVNALTNDGSGNISLGGEMTAIGRRYDTTTQGRIMGGYAVANLHAAREIDRGWSLEARLNNLFDRVYENAWSYAVPGRELFVGLRYTPK